MSAYEPPHTLKVVTGWLLVGLAVFLGVQWWMHERERTRFQSTGETIEIRRGPDGHYHWPGTINGRPVDFVVDTGATGMAIPAALARELDLPLGEEIVSSTAGGEAVGRLTRADVELKGGLKIERLRLTALPGLTVPLLGMNVLGKLHWRQRDGVLTIETGPAR